jgi:hypothetical protein
MLDRVIARYRANAKSLRDATPAGKDAQMDKHFNDNYANIWDAAADILEEEIRQFNRVHQDKT